MQVRDKGKLWHCATESNWHRNLYWYGLIRLPVRESLFGHFKNVHQDQQKFIGPPVIVHLFETSHSQFLRGGTTLGVQFLWGRTLFASLERAILLRGEMSTLYYVCSSFKTSQMHYQPLSNHQRQTSEPRHYAIISANPKTGMT